MGTVQGVGVEVEGPWAVGKLAPPPGQTPG